MNFKTIFLRNIIVFSLLFSITFSIFYKSLDVFFVQDDFILINHFSQNSLWLNFTQIFAFPNISHWRPLQNLYFLVVGNLFGRFYPGYHASILIMHVILAFVIFKVLKLWTKDRNASFLGAIVYAIHPSHFVSIFWISGFATSIGPLFLISSFYLYLEGKKNWTLLLLVLSLLTSEAMVVGAVIFLGYEFLVKRKKMEKLFLLKVIAISLTFLLLKFLFLTPSATFKTYPLEISKDTITALRYYFLRTLGFAETSQDTFTSKVLIVWIASITITILRIFNGDNKKFILFFTLSAFAGLFPYVLIPNHLSPHYLNISIWAFASTVTFGFVSLKPSLRLIFVLTFVFTSILNIQLTYKNNWVIKRSEIAKLYVEKIESENPPTGTLLIFDDSSISTSSEAYFALGTGKALEFWFARKNYKTCFSAFENCPSNN
ncbi:hypothetical protein A3E66_00210 [Candidatus Daviesbacteria bacterium RIFCSPHIGHO2_12_FULL_37_16]|uniref:Glycosyltransferase RgtA/B/C/D-like domain-containing protein n=1 Tax=Candidatus Daviesbacteria bacterium RIFCSPHIGHO2_12_FULL_37_16 TaxID=1797778 RepID=A0A1F5K377_9BACT|nr:MAG: hypothetical protein A3E66_00210 [Candidatus Daviesbacteria bacterium RIFCSPHIGHO2_12_FULL_37_16]